jgi:hypothetical protein
VMLSAYINIYIYISIISIDVRSFHRQAALGLSAAAARRLAALLQTLSKTELRRQTPKGGGVRQCQETLTRAPQTLITDNSPLSIGL